MIVDEPVRGSSAPPWFWALSGIERIRAFVDGTLPAPPVTRLLGTRISHVSAGSVTCAMHAGEASVGLAGQIQFTAFVEAALHVAATTALPSGVTSSPLTLCINHFRPARPSNGSLLARAHVVNVSTAFVFTEAELEDASGRRLAHAVSQAAIRRVDPPPPAPPSPLRRVEEPVYTSPDPYLRSPSGVLVGDPAPGEGWLAYLRGLADGTLTLPIASLYGIRFERIDEGHVVFTAPASEWFRLFRGDTVSPGVLGALASTASFVAGYAMKQPWRENGAGLDQFVRFFRPVVVDGRPIRVEARNAMCDDDTLVNVVNVYDAEGRLVAQSNESSARIEEATRRGGHHQKETKRVLATLLFTDIVGSTEHAGRLGDAAWRVLLDEHHQIVRRAIAQHGGVEVKTVGDGFFVRFESPARALECARRLLSSLKRIGVEIRAGIHTGECELQGRDLAGMAVHVAARLVEAAAPGDILVSGTVKDLTIGSSLQFRDRGETSLKGIPGTWRLYALA